MKLEVLKERFTVCKTASFPEALFDGGFVFIGKTDRERSLVCETSRVPADALTREDGWRAFRVAGQLDFSLVGILSKITSSLAAAGIGVFAVSTFDTDYVLVKEQDLENALSALCAAGYEAVQGEETL
ncbi:MAG: ACT domain-containing protein [Clostridia bacterium]|nr:ACT domain-containing protein [Clostridia bacterium]